MYKKVKWPGGALLAPVPAVLVTCGNEKRSNVFTVAWTGILNTNPATVYISVRPTRYSYNLIKEQGEFDFEGSEMVEELTQEEYEKLKSMLITAIGTMELMRRNNLGDDDCE